MKNKLNVLILDKELFFRCCWISKQLLSILLLCYLSEILFEQQKMMLGAVNLGKSYQNTGQLQLGHKKLIVKMSSLLFLKQYVAYDCHNVFENRLFFTL